MIWLVSAGLLGFIYAWQIEPRWFKLRRLTLSDARLKSPIRLVFISDIHITWHSSRSIIRHNLSLLREEHTRQPFDYILVGGDFFDRSDRNELLLRWLCSQLHSFDVPVLAVLGNHDTQFRAISNQKVREILKETGIEVIENQAVSLEKGSSRIQLIGLQELESGPDYLRGKYFIQNREFYYKNLKNIDWYQKFDDKEPDLFRIVMSHNPDAVYLPGERRPELHLSGHTHAGQIIFATWIGLIFNQINPHGSFKSWAGVRKINNTNLAVSNGFGMGLMPLRFGCRPDAIIINLESAKASR